MGIRTSSNIVIKKNTKHIASVPVEPVKNYVVEKTDSGIKIKTPLSSTPNPSRLTVDTTKVDPVFSNLQNFTVEEIDELRNAFNINKLRNLVFKKSAKDIPADLVKRAEEADILQPKFLFLNNLNPKLVLDSKDYIFDSVYLGKCRPLGTIGKLDEQFDMAKFIKKNDIYTTMDWDGYRLTYLGALNGIILVGDKNRWRVFNKIKAELESDESNKGALAKLEENFKKTPVSKKSFMSKCEKNKEKYDLAKAKMNNLAEELLEDSPESVVPVCYELNDDKRVGIVKLVNSEPNPYDVILHHRSKKRDYVFSLQSDVHHFLQKAYGDFDVSFSENQVQTLLHNKEFMTNQNMAMGTIDEIEDDWVTSTFSVRLPIVINKDGKKVAIVEAKMTAGAKHSRKLANGIAKMYDI